MAGKDSLIKVLLQNVADQRKFLVEQDILEPKSEMTMPINEKKAFITLDQANDERIKSVNLKMQLERRRTEEKMIN